MWSVCAIAKIFSLTGKPTEGVKWHLNPNGILFKESTSKASKCILSNGGGLIVLNTDNLDKST